MYIFLITFSDGATACVRASNIYNAEILAGSFGDVTSVDARVA